jgi:pentapeptide MXKDX repeat protein
MGRDLMGRDHMSWDRTGRDLMGRDLMSWDLTGRHLMSQDLMSWDRTGGDLMSQDLMSQDLTGRDFISRRYGLGPYGTDPNKSVRSRPVTSIHKVLTRQVLTQKVPTR